MCGAFLVTLAGFSNCFGDLDTRMDRLKHPSEECPSKTIDLTGGSMIFSSLEGRGYEG